jgi:hypothetical protein
VFYGDLHRDGEAILWFASGDDWTNFDEFGRIFTSSDLGLGAILQQPAVVRIEDRYVLQFTAGTNINELRERSLYRVEGPSPYKFGTNPDLLLEPGPEGSWDERRVYSAQWLKKQDGNYYEPLVIDGCVRLYYSGHDLGHHDAARWKNKIMQPSIGSYKHVEKDNILKLVARKLLTRWRRPFSILFGFNRGYTGLAEYDYNELLSAQPDARNIEDD